MSCCGAKVKDTGTGAPIQNAQVLRVEDMTCGSCANTILKAISDAVPGAKIQIETRSRTVRVADSVNLNAVVAAIRRAGFTPKAVEPAT